jgi:hypothetical protein
MNEFDLPLCYLKLMLRITVHLSAQGEDKCAKTRKTDVYIGFSEEHFRSAFKFWTLSIIAFYLRHTFLETELCLRLQVEPTQLGQIDRASPCCRLLGPYY